MARHIHLQSYLSIDELEHRPRTAKEPERADLVAHPLAARSGPAGDGTAAVIGYRTYWIGHIAKRYNEFSGYWPRNDAGG
jgi:hypothetical protein